MDSLGKKLINDHRNPIVKVDISGSKLFLKSSTVEQIEYIKKCQANFENILSHERAERRCGRCLAQWSPEDKLSKVSKAGKTISNFGYRDRNGMFLYPEETLYLMETNRLEVTFNEIPLSIQEGYDVLLKSCPLLKYKVYKKLVHQGYKLLRHSEVLRRRSKITVEHEINPEHNEVQNNESKRKRTTDEINYGDSKKKKIISEAENSSSSASASTNSKQLESFQINNIFERLQKKAPKEYINNVTGDRIPDYYLFLPTNKSRCDYDFSLYICEDSSFLKWSNCSSPSLFAICSDGNISFYKFASVKLPFL